MNPLNKNLRLEFSYKGQIIKLNPGILFQKPAQNVANLNAWTIHVYLCLIDVMVIYNVQMAWMSTDVVINSHMSHDMWFPTMWYLTSVDSD